MKNNFKKIAVAAAVGAALGVSGAAQADEVLFPYFATGGGKLTFVQLINEGAPATSGSLGVHFAYVYSAGEEVCQHYDSRGVMTENDLMMYEVAGGEGVTGLPGDTTSTAPVLPIADPAEGYLVVSNYDYVGTADEGSLWGQAYVVDTDNMVAYMYNAINDPSEAGNTAEFYDNASDEHTLSWLPSAYATTTFFAFPVDGSVLNSPNVYTYGISYGNWTIGDSAGGVYNNNESLKSGTKTLTPGCRLNDDNEIVSNQFMYALNELMSVAQANETAAGGGWTDAEFDNYGYVYKIVTSNVFGSTVGGMMAEPDREGTNNSYTR